MSREAARSALIWVYFDNGQHDSAVALANQNIDVFPNGTSFLWPLAKASFEDENYAEAIRLYSILRDRIATQAGNFYNLVECDYRLARAYDEIGDKGGARSTAARLANYDDNLPHSTRNRQRSKLAYLEQAGKVSQANQAALEP